MKPSEILRAGLNLLETKGWTKGTYGRDYQGESVNAEEAICFCGIGAIRTATFSTFSMTGKQLNDQNYRNARRLLESVTVSHMGPTQCFAKWQDDPNRTFAEVKSKFLEAIQLAEQQEQAV